MAPAADVMYRQNRHQDKTDEQNNRLNSIDPDDRRVTADTDIHHKGQRNNNFGHINIDAAGPSEIQTAT